ncbi:hypothetical protein [Streptomyces qinzhouensis]|uniref:Uncharacterized protein n=1 Tax=Streptomyces qinzhouensis TaxID=2599401 RepID=A0A5B8IPC7_9ACTN|nr:hypothetical protein [Streptomyces qinzhouensis]QDY80498.1 hypothetical protein FQU76_32750 [Streptomyces qinzhouensis]
MAVLVPVLAAGWIWWRESDTAARWRFEDAMDSWCGGLTAYEKGPLFEGLATDIETSKDRRLGTESWRCFLGGGGGSVTVARLPGEARIRGQEALPPLRGKQPPGPLGGDWQGSANGETTAVLLDCRNTGDAIAVAVFGHPGNSERAEYRDNFWTDADLHWARFATATAVKAAGKWNCDAVPGKALTALPAVTGEESTDRADGTCAGLPFTLDSRLNTVFEAPADRGSLVELCRVGSTNSFDGHYAFLAEFGPYAERRDTSGIEDRTGHAGVRGTEMWASARCPGATERTAFSGFLPAEAATVPDDEGNQGERFGMPAFRAFAERAAERHGCTDLKLPPAKG